MGKNKFARHKVFVQPVVPNRTGMLDDQVVTMKYNKESKRYDFKVDGVLLISSVNAAGDCTHLAENKNVVWDA